MPNPPESNIRNRTRRAILDAAVTALAKDAGTSMADIASAAGVGRTTIHRYFPERADLLRSISQDALERVTLATERARLDEGGAVEAIRRLAQGYFELGEIFSMLFNNPHMLDDDWTAETESDRAVTRLFERGLNSGELDPFMTPEWGVHVLWCTLYAAWTHATEDNVSKHEALSRCLVTITKSLKNPDYVGG